MKLLHYFLLFLLSLPTGSFCWGFYSHKLINRQAVFSLPPEVIVLFKNNIKFITENAVNPDKRRYAVKGEAEKHYIDLDAYGDSAAFNLPRYWAQALEAYKEDTLRALGIAPWNAYLTFLQLSKAFEKKDKNAILRLAADLGHYLGDINVPLHTTQNYNGQYTGQYGIHGFWETRLPELFSGGYDFFVGKAEYIHRPQDEIWNAVCQAHFALDSVLNFEAELTQNFPPDKKYSYEERNGINTRVYSKTFSKAYHQQLSGQVERQMQKSIKMIADFWFTAWVLAGQPDLSDPKLDLNQRKENDSIPPPDQELKNLRDHETSKSNRGILEIDKYFFGGLQISLNASGQSFKSVPEDVFIFFQKGDPEAP